MKKLEIKIQKIEKLIQELEVKLKEKTDILGETSYQDTDKYAAAVDEFNKAEKALEEAMALWEDAEMEREELSA